MRISPYLLLISALGTLGSCSVPIVNGKAVPNTYSLVWCLVLAGVLAGLANYFLTYLGLPTTSQKKENALVGQLSEPAAPWPKTQTEWIAILGYIIVGICGALLTPVVHAIVTLKGLNTEDKGFAPLYNLIIFGYGLVFGYSASRLFPSLFAVIKIPGEPDVPSEQDKPTVTAVPTVSKALAQLYPGSYAANDELVRQVAKNLNFTFNATDAAALKALLTNPSSGWQQLANGEGAAAAVSGPNLVLAAVAAGETFRLAVVSQFKDDAPIGHWGGPEAAAQGRGEPLIYRFAPSAGDLTYYSAAIPSS